MGLDKAYVPVGVFTTGKCASYAKLDADNNINYTVRYDSYLTMGISQIDNVLLMELSVMVHCK